MSRSSQPNPKSSQSSSRLSTSRSLLQYKNGFFQGYVDEYTQRHGRGVYFWNTGEIYYGDWSQDHMEGEGIFYFALGGYVYGTFLDDRVHGYAVLCFSNGDYTAGFWERGVLNGKVVQHSKEENDWCLEEYKDGQCIRMLMKGKGAPPLDNFSMLETYSLKKLLEKGTGLFAGEKEGEQKNSSRANLDFLAIEPDGWYHGNIQARGPHGLGIVCYSEHKSDRGLFKNGALTGLGRSLFSNGDVYDGFYKEGKFQGIGVYFKSETDQYLYGMYEGNECVQALTLGNGYPHELMRTLKADFHLDTAEFVNKETETEVLTLSYNEQNDQNPIQEQESPLQYVESSKHKFEENNNNRNNNGRKRVEEQKQETMKSIQDSELSARSQRRAAESEKIRKETETQSSVSQQGYPYDVNSIKREKGGSRSKVTDSARIKNSSYSDISDDQNEFLVRGKSVQASEVLDQKPVSKGTVDSQVKVKSTEKIPVDNYPSRGSDIDKEVTVHVTSVSYPVSPKYDYHSEAHHNNNQGNGRDSGVHYSQKQVQSEPQRVETFSGSTGQQRWDSPSRLSEGLAPYVVRASEMIEKISTVVPYEAKPNCSNIAEYTIVDRSPNAKTSVQNTSYTPITPAPAVNDTTSYYQNQPSQGSGSVVANITSGIDSQVKKIMDKIFTGNTNNSQNIVSALNIPPNPNTETDTTRAGSYLLSAPEIYPKSSDRSPTFAQAHNEPNLGFDYKFTNNSSVYTGSYVENKEKTHMDHLTTDWNIKVFPSLSSSLINSDTKKMGDLPQATASFGLIPSAASEESLASKVLQAGIRQSQTSNNFLEVDAFKETRERAPTGKFGGANTEITNVTVMPESYKAETTHKSYNFSGNNQISTSHEDIDTKSYLKAKTPINKKIEHSNYEIKVGTYGTDYTGTDYTKTYDLGPSKLYDEHNLKSAAGNYGSYESPSGRGSIISKTDTWSVPATMQKIGDVGGSLVYNEKQGELSASELLQKYGGYDKSSYHHQTDLTVKRSSLYEASSSDIFDNGSISNRYELKTKEYTYTPEKKSYEIPVSSSVPVYSFEKESSSSPVKLEEDLYKIILLKLELLVKEQSKATEAMDDVKKSLNDKLDQLFRQERRESEGFKLLLNQKLDMLFKEKTFDLSRDQLTQIHQELIGNQKQVSASFNGVNKKLDMLLLKQGRLSMETEENLVNKLVTKHTRHESIQSTKHAEDHRRSLKNHDSNENVRSEIFIADSSADYNATTAKKRPGADSKVFRSESAGKNSQISVASQKEQKKEASNVLVKDIAHHTELSKASAQNRRVDNDMCNVSDDAMDYASVASDTAPIKVINSMQPKSKELSIKNEHTINLIQYESELRSAKSQQDKQYRTANKSDKEQVNTPRSKTAAGARSMTPTPQSKNHVEISYRNNNDARSPRPITSQNSSMIMDTQPPTYRQYKAEIYNSGKSPRATNQVSFKGRESVQSNVNTNTITLSPEKKEMSQWHVIPLCAQDSLLDEPEEIIEEERQDSQTPSEERKTQALPSPANFTNRSHVSKGQVNKKPNNNHNRANSISSQSSYNVFDLKSYNRLSIKNGEGSFRKGRESKDIQDKVPNNTAHSVFDNFVVTSNNNDIPVGAEYVRIEKNSAVHRNMSFMRKDMESPNAPKFTGSAKKQTQKEVDLYEEEGKHKRKSAQKETAYFRNEEDVYDNCSTGRNQDGYQHASPMRVRKEQISPNRTPKTVYQEGRVGTMRWRLEIEDMANDTECDRIDEMESAETKGYYANTGFDRKMKSISAMNSPISQRREMDSLLKTVNIGKDISQYDNYMYSPNKNRPEDVVSSRAASYRKTEVKVPSLPLGHDAKGYECYEDTLRNQGYYMQNGAHQAKQGHW